MTPELGLAGGFVLLVLLVLGVFVVFYFVPLPLWIAAWASGAHVGLLTLIGMRLRRVPPGTVVTARIGAVKAGLDIPLNELEAHYLAGGNVVNVVRAMISAGHSKGDSPLFGRGTVPLGTGHPEGHACAAAGRIPNLERRQRSRFAWL
jgi:uncharacterized protein YqfA (UPF0365 family)